MAYDSSNLTAIMGGNGFNQWHYKSSVDTLATIEAYGYFSGHSGTMVKTSDVMTVEGTDAICQYQASAAGGGVALDRMGHHMVKDSKRLYLSDNLGQTDLLAGTSHFVGTHVAGHVTRFTAIVTSAVTTGGTLTIELAGTAVAGLSITVADATAAGTVLSAVPDEPFLAAHLVPAITAGGTGDIEIVGDSSFGTAGNITCIVEVTPYPTALNNNVAVWSFLNQTDLMAGTSHFVIAPVAGFIEAGHTVVKKAIASTGGTLTVELGGTAVNGLGVVVANSAAVGDNDTDAPSSLTHATAAVTAGQAIEFVGDTAFDSAGEVWMSVEINPTTDSDVQTYAYDYIGQTDLLAGTSHYVVAPASGHVTKMSVVVKKAVTTGGTLTLELGGDKIAGIDCVIANSASVGTVVTDTPTKSLGEDSRVTKGDAIEIVGDAAFATAGEVWVMIEVTPS